MLFNEPKLLKYPTTIIPQSVVDGFSALQRAEIAEIGCAVDAPGALLKVSVLFNEPKLLKFSGNENDSIAISVGFSALQRAEIAEIAHQRRNPPLVHSVSVLFNEPKLLKSRPPLPAPPVSQIPIPARRRS